MTPAYIVVIGVCIIVVAIIAYRARVSVTRGDISDSCDCLYTPTNRENPAEASLEGIDPDYTKLLNSESCYRAIFEHAGEAIFIMQGEGDNLGRIITCNQAAAGMHGYTIQELQDMNIHDLDPISTQEEAMQRCKCLLNGDWMRNELLHLKKNGEKIPIECHAGIIEFEGHKYIIAFDRDISDRKQAEEMLNFMAYYDNLTGLPNRMLFIDRLKLAMAHAHRDNERLAVLYVDIDNFKAINNTLGHINGDGLLQAVAERLTDSLREGDTVARIGGDEFALLLPKVESDEDAAKIATKLLDAFRVPFDMDGKDYYVTATIGISLYPDDASEAQTLMQNADTSLSQAKLHGNNSYRFFAPNMNEKVSERLTLESSLRRALEQNEFLLYYQPQVDAESGDIVGVEALLRWRCPDNGMVQPMDFIPLAEETGLILPIGKWVLTHACKQNKQWQDKGYKPVRISVNISARQFLDNLVVTVSEALAESGLDPKYLELELTESILMYDIDEAVAICMTLKDMGISLSIDDFGTGYSSLSYLKRFPLERLKIDRMFITTEETSSNDSAIVKAIIAMAHSLNLTSIAEGVETIEQLEFLKTLECREIQGFLFSHPVPAEEFEKFFTQDGRLVA